MTPLLDRLRFLISMPLLLVVAVLGSLTLIALELTCWLSPYGDMTTSQTDDSFTIRVRHKKEAR